MAHQSTLAKPLRAAGRSLALLAGVIASAGAVAIGAVMAVFFAAAMVMTAVLASALLALVGAALRAGRARRRPTEPDLIEARHLGGHHWVAYGWDGGR
ncbi:MAG: hypothetical protein ACRED9_15190 [Caulobacteraceae bacterium]